MLRMQDFGEIAFGGVVTLTEWWDDKRIDEGKIASNEVWKKASFWTYLGIGLTATLMSAMGWWKRQELWTEHISHGFLYDVPRFIYGVVKSMGATAGRGGSKSAAVREAQEIIARGQAARQLGAGRRVGRSYQPEFEQVAPHAF